MSVDDVDDVEMVIASRMPQALRDQFWKNTVKNTVESPPRFVDEDLKKYMVGGCFIESPSRVDAKMAEEERAVLVEQEKQKGMKKRPKRR